MSWECFGWAILFVLIAQGCQKQTRPRPKPRTARPKDYKFGHNSEV